VLAQDADFDGNCITGLMLVFFVKFFPQVIREGRLFKLMTPIVIATKGNETKEYYEHKHYNNEKAFLEANGYTIKYNKGLGQIGDAQFKKLMQNPRLMPIMLDDYADLSMFTWFLKHIDNKIMRKQYLIDAAGHNVDEETLQAAYDAVQMSQDLS
jgi:DNA gyrase/topoisomerase IV subunit B